MAVSCLLSGKVIRFAQALIYTQPKLRRRPGLSLFSWFPVDAVLARSILAWSVLFYAWQVYLSYCISLLAVERVGSVVYLCHFLKASLSL